MNLCARFECKMPEIAPIEHKMLIYRRSVTLLPYKYLKCREHQLAAVPMLPVTKKTVPSYLRSSPFLQGWDDCDGETVNISSTVMKLDTRVCCLEGLRHLLMSLRYWIVHDTPGSVFNYVLGNVPSLCRATLKEFESDLPCARLLLRLLETNPEDYWRIALLDENVDCVRYMFHQRIFSNFELSESCTIAASVGSIKCLEFLRSKGCPWNEEVCASAAKSGHLQCLIYLHTNGCPWDVKTCEQSAAAGHATCLKYAFGHNCPCNRQTLFFAAENGHINALQIFTEFDGSHDWYGRVADYAAQGGQIGVLKYLRAEKKCSGSEHTTARAARFGHLESLKYLHEAGCPWGEHTCFWAAVKNHFDCLRYAIENGCPCTPLAYIRAGSDEIRDYLTRTRGLQP